MKYLFVLILCWIAWRLLRPALRKPPPSREHGGERMIACAHCGIYAPEREMLRAENGGWYCSPEHRAAAEEDA